jgi:hypothetical protein
MEEHPAAAASATTPTQLPYLVRSYERRCDISEATIQIDMGALLIRLTAYS